MAAPLVIAGSAIGLGIAWGLERGKGLPKDVAFIDAEAASGITFLGGPVRERVLYNLHPARPDLYVPDSQYKRFMLEERARQAERFFLHCGASRIELEVERGEKLELDGSLGASDARGGVKARATTKRTSSSARKSVVEAPGSARPGRLRGEEWLWARVEPEWLDLREKRTKYKVTTHRLVTTVEDERAVSGDARARLGKLMKVDVAGSSDKPERTTWVWHLSFPT